MSTACQVIRHVTSVKRHETRLVHGELTAGESCFIIATKPLRSFFTETPSLLLHRDPLHQKGMGKEAKPRVHPCPHCLANFRSPSKRQSTY